MKITFDRTEDNLIVETARGYVLVGAEKGGFVRVRTSERSSRSPFPMLECRDEYLPASDARVRNLLEARASAALGAGAWLAHEYLRRAVHMGAVA